VDGLARLRHMFRRGLDWQATATHPIEDLTMDESTTNDETSAEATSETSSQGAGAG
jgi:hypothetical protein